MIATKNTVSISSQVSITFCYIATTKIIAAIILSTSKAISIRIGKNVMKLRQEGHGEPDFIRNKLETDVNKIKNTLERQKIIDAIPSVNNISSYFCTSNISKDEIIMNRVELSNWIKDQECFNRHALQSVEDENKILVLKKTSIHNKNV